MQPCVAVMTKNPICCQPSDSVMKVAQWMKRENIGSIPVIENTETRKLVGIVTDRDLALKIVGEGSNPKEVKVEEVMTFKLVTCRPDDDIQRALDMMSEHQLRRIPIVDDEHKVIGIISQADIATRVNQPDKTAEIVKDISQAS